MVYIISILLFIICAVVYIKLAQHFNIVDNPSFRSSHTIPTIRGGGILFYIAIVLFFILSDFQYPIAFSGISMLALVSFIDDIQTLAAKVRLPFQFISVALLVYQIGFFEAHIGWVVLAIIIGVGFINLYNFMDGINGITGLYSMVVLVSLLFINTTELIINPDLIYYPLLAIAVFGYYNFRKKARLFAGDVGSITMAMLLFFLGILFILKLQAPVLLLLVLIYGLDSVLTIIYRIYLKEHIMQPHRHHIYQKLVDIKKWSHMQVSATYAVLQLLVNIVVIITYKLPILQQLGVLAGFIVMGIVGYGWLFKGLKVRSAQHIDS